MANSQAVTGCIMIGVGSHGLICCPHMITGIFSVGSTNTNCGTGSSIRIGDSFVHNCPHCNGGLASSGSATKTIGLSKAARIGDSTTFLCGGGSIVSGINTVIVG